MLAEPRLALEGDAGARAAVAAVKRVAYLDHDDAVGTLGHRRAGHDARCLPGADHDAGDVVARGDVVDDVAARRARRRAAPARSAARTAKPSIAELSNGATSMSLRASSASTRPSESSSGTRSAGKPRDAREDELAGLFDAL